MLVMVRYTLMGMQMAIDYYMTMGKPVWLVFIHFVLYLILRYRLFIICLPMFLMGLLSLVLLNIRRCCLVDY